MPPKKRARAPSSSSKPEAGPPRRRSQRVSSGPAARKSTYFEAESDDVDTPDEPPPKRLNQSKAAPSRRKAEEVDEESDDYDDGDDDEDDNDNEEEEEGEEDSSREATPPPKKRGRGRGRPSKQQQQQQQAKQKATKQKLKAVKAKQPESDGDDGESEDDDEEENRVTFIPLPKLRDTDGVEYEDTRLHKNTLEFLKDLKANNKRSWLKMRDPEYRRSLKDWESFVETLTERIIEADETVPELPIKDVIFRIYRDIRFSKDQTPYKAHYGAAWSRTGRKGPYACYYVHVEPGSCLVGGGLWHPDNDALAKLRASVDERPQRLRRVLTNPAFKRTFLPSAKDGDEGSILAAFAKANKENALKTKPKGFHPEHRDIEILKLRNYTAFRKIDDSVFTSDDAQDQIMAIITAMVPFVTFLNSVVMPDPNLDSDSDGEDDDEEEEGEGDDRSTEA